MSKNVGQLNVKLTAETKPLEQGVNQAVNTLKEAQTEIQKTDVSSLDNLKNTINTVFSSIKNISSEIKSQWDAARVPVQSVNDDINNMSNSINLLRLPIDEFSNKISELSKEELEGIFDEITLEINEAKLGAMGLKQDLAGIEKSRINSTVIKEIRAAINQTTLDTQVLKSKLSLVKNTLNSIKSDNIKDIGSNLKQINNSANQVNISMSKTFKKGLNSLKRFSLGLMGIRMGFSYLLQSMRTYIDSSETMTAKTEGISQALAQSLSPYAEIAVSALQKLVHWVILGVAYFTTFMNTIFGTKIAIVGADKSIKSLTKDTKKAGKEAQNALAPFDDLNILQEGNASSAESSYVAPDFSGLGISQEEFSGLTEFGNWLNDNKETIQWLLVTITAIVAAWTLWNIAVGVFNALMALNPIVLILMGAVAVILLIITHWETFMAVVNAGFEIIKSIIDAILAIVLSAISIISGVITLLFNTITTGLNFVGDLFGVIFNLIKGIVMTVINIIIGYWNLLFNNISSIINGVLNIITTVFNGVKDFILKIIQGDIPGAFNSLKNIVINVFSIIWNTVKNIFSNIWTFISDIAGGIGEVFANTIRGIVNSIIGFAENTINSFLKAINVAIGIINAIPGVNIKKLKLLEIPRLASGTVATGPMVAEIGEYSGAKSNPEIVSPRDMMYETMVKALRENQQTSSSNQQLDMTIYVKYEDGKTIIKKINAAQDEAGRTLLEV